MNATPMSSDVQLPLPTAEDMARDHAARATGVDRGPFSDRHQRRISRAWLNGWRGDTLALGGRASDLYSLREAWQAGRRTQQARAAHLGKETGKVSASGDTA